MNAIINREKPPLIVIAGPTAVGKTSLSIRLAQELGGEIISADSMQVYRGMDIGSAKVTPEEMQGVPHHLINILDPEEDFNVVRFQSLAKEAAQEIIHRGHIPVLVGGTGFYVQALLRDIHFTEAVEDPEYRRSLEDRAAAGEGDKLYQELTRVDPDSARIIHANNFKRIIRALEFYHSTGEKISEHNAAERERKSPYRFLYLVLNRDRAELYRRIDRRVDQMMDDGLIYEVIRLREAGCRSGMVSMQGLGYKQIMRYLDGDWTIGRAVAAIRQETRHFAKRQLTWFRREGDICDWIQMDDGRTEEEILQDILALARERGITS